MAFITAGRMTDPRAFNARIIHVLPLPEISKGGLTKPIDHLAYLHIHKEAEIECHSEFKKRTVLSVLHFHKYQFHVCIF